MRALTSPRPLHLAALLTGALLVASCGDKDSGDSGPSGEDTAVGEDTSAADDTGGADDSGGADGEDTSASEDDTSGGGDTSANGDDTGSAADDTGDTAPVEVPLDGFGDLSGDCGALDDELSDGSSSFFSNTLDFGEAEYDYDQLSEGGKAIYDAGNLGGSSIYSEVFAFEVLYRCELAELLETEGEISYDTESKKTDMLLSIDGIKIGVSVTRAYVYPPDTEYTTEMAAELLEDKLSDVIASSESVSDEDRWQKQILSVIAYTPDHADAIRDGYDELDSDVKADTILYVTATEGEDEFLY